ncbi:2-C-methyl-D-erythritol 4-phosphate cytidylyltransferase 2 [Coriobacteriaceae bacterium CHKCI002]|nr:2-C-methyl-D-erythritol 4-phosphate cytidylyltransferase 2 [Coriobacteriaceae bacterium CHKCI002]
MNIESMPKQFLPLGGKPVLLHTLEKFALCNRFDAIFVGVHKDWISFTEKLVAESGVLGIPVFVVEGGSDRTGTIMRIVDAIEESYGESDDHVIVTHDSVRPFVSLEIIEANIDAAFSSGACDTVISATDTIVCSEDGWFIESIPDRSHMYQGQTPQSFRIPLLRRAYELLSDDERERLTDACGMLSKSGIPVQLVEGSVSNIKLTTIMDYKMAQAMVETY